MRPFPLIALLICLVPTLFTLAARIPIDARKEITAVVVLEAREEPTSTATSSLSDDGTVATTTASATATIHTGNSTSTSNSTAPASTTIASLNTSSPSNNETEEHAKPAKPGELPLQPKITPAFGVGGFVLIVLGAILALIGIRKIWVQVFLSTAFLASLGVTVLIVYVMNPPVRTAVQGAYLVAVIFTGLTFGALSIVFKELTEGLGCLLGGFCCSMWLLALKPGGLLTRTDAKSGFIAALSVAFYALSFSHYTRPYGLIVATAIAGGTSVALGIDCYSRAGLKEFWLYIWSLNDDIFPLGTDTYPVTRNIRVELAVTVIVALMGVVSQLRLWRVIRERRHNEMMKREEEQRKKDEAEAEAGRRLEENNVRERMEWEARYGNGEAKTSSENTEVADETQKDINVGDLEKGHGVNVESVDGSSIKSYRCSDCRERGDDASSDVSGAAGDTQAPVHDGDEAHDAAPGDETPLPFKVFDGAAAAKVKRDDESDVTAIVGSEVGTIRSKRFSGMSMLRRMSVRSSVKITSQSQEALVAPDDDDNSSTQGIQDDEPSDPDSRHSSRAPEAQALKPADEHNSEAQKTSAGGETLVNGDGVVKEPSQKNESHQEQENAQKQESGQIEQPSKEESSTPGATVVEQVSSDKHISVEKANDPAQNATVADIPKSPSTGKPTPRVSEGIAKRMQQFNKQDSPPVLSQGADAASKAGSESQKQDNVPSKSLKSKSSKLSIPEKTAQKQEPETKAPEEKASEQQPSESQGQQSNTVDAKEASETNQSDVKAQTETKPADNNAAGPVEEQKPPAPKEKQPVKPKKEEKPVLNSETVKHLPERTSRVVQSYRTNEWAKHLADAEAPDMEPIQPIEEEKPEVPIEVEEAAAPVNVKELLQTPLNAQPPPAPIETRRVSLSKEQLSPIEARRSLNTSPMPQPEGIPLTSLKSPPKPGIVRSPTQLSRSSSTSTSHNPRSPPAEPSQNIINALPNASNAFIHNTNGVDQSRAAGEAANQAKPQWKGPPPLLAVREDMVRNRLSSTSLSIDPYLSRNHPRHSTQALPLSPTYAIPEEDDDVPLSQRRAMLHKQSNPGPLVNLTPQPPRPHQTRTPSPANAQAVMAAWRESVREDLTQKQNPLGSLQSPVSPTERTPSPFGQQPQRSSSVNIGNAIAEGMQRGDMTDLHREAMRRMQASASRGFNPNNPDK